MKNTIDITALQQRFFAGVHERERSAEEAGAAAGLAALAEEPFTAMISAEIQRLAEECSTLPSAELLARQRQALEDVRSASLARIRAIRADWETAARTAATAGRGGVARRLLVCGLLAAALGLGVRLAGGTVRWEFYALLGVLALLAALEPLRLTTRLQTATLAGLEFAALLGAGMQAAWASFRLARFEVQSRNRGFVAETLGRWQQVGLESLTGRYRHQYARATAASRLTIGE